MGATATTGHKAGARRVDADKYMPPPGDWEETNIVHDFGNKWLICDDHTDYDRRLNAQLTLTCIASLIPRCIPFDREQAIRFHREQQIRIYNTPYYIKNWGEEKVNKYVEQYVETYKKRLSAPDSTPAYKIMHLRDPKKRPRACLLMMLENISKCPSRYGSPIYHNSRDIGQEVPVEIDGEKFLLLECRLGSGRDVPQIAEKRIIEWYKTASGQWNEKLYKAAFLKRLTYTAVRTTEAIDKYRRQALVLAGAPA